MFLFCFAVIDHENFPNTFALFSERWDTEAVVPQKLPYWPFMQNTPHGSEYSACKLTVHWKELTSEGKLATTANVRSTTDTQVQVFWKEYGSWNHCVIPPAFWTIKWNTEHSEVWNYPKYQRNRNWPWYLVYLPVLLSQYLLLLNGIFKRIKNLQNDSC